MYKEGSITITGGAFINEKAKFTRDLSILIVNCIKSKHDIKNVLDPTAATGIRGMRYNKEAGINEVDFLEINETSYASLKKNIKQNKIKGNAYNVSIQEFANTTKNKYDVIDLDPFGGASPYIFDIMKIAKDNTLLFVTITDTAVLCGAHTNACLKLYNAVPLHNEICHEAGLRILIGYIARIAASFNFGIDVHLSMVYKHYMRVWLQLNYNSNNALASIKNIGYMFFCNSCGNRGSKSGFAPTIDKCSVCNSKLTVGGPLWIGKLKNTNTINYIIKEMDSLDIKNEDKKIINNILNENDANTCYSISHMTHRLKLGSVKQSYVVGELKNMGYDVSVTHYNPNMIRTNAAYSDIVNVIKKLYDERISHK